MSQLYQLMFVEVMTHTPDLTGGSLPSGEREHQHSTSCCLWPPWSSADDSDLLRIHNVVLSVAVNGDVTCCVPVVCFCLYFLSYCLSSISHLRDSCAHFAFHIRLVKSTKRVVLKYFQSSSLCHISNYDPQHSFFLIFFFVLSF